MANTDFPVAFKLKSEGSTAVVRFCHSSKDTIEKLDCHWIQKGETWRHVKCLGENCPACANGFKKDSRAYIRLYDYTDNTYKVWDRTCNSKFFDAITDIEGDWGPLNTLVLKITRDSNDFPTYSVNVVPSKNYPAPANFDNEVDQKIAYRMVSSRSAEDVLTFINTGTMPPKQQRTNANESNKNTNTNTQNNNSVAKAQSTSSTAVADDYDDDDLPF